ncbi:acyltransferase family protein [Ferruginibacter sp. SUN106]|uniref:acyltransferase family protein n=1 Tax=Ferruginibacter sp. SUN106 TaxID=2978348 RepID=UPI003D35BA40
MKKNRLEKLEALRGFAALYVVFFHTLPQKIYLLGINVGAIFRFGPEAVIVFFVLSGFVIKYTFERSANKTFKYYFIRRFIRLYIPLFFIFILGYGLKCYSEGALADPDWKTLLGNIFMLQDVISQKPNVISAAYMGNGVLWSLSYEWWFYMLFFFLSKNISSDKLNKWVSIIVIVAAASYVIYPFIVNRLAMYFAIWWIGVRFADTYIKGEKYSIKSILPYAYVLFIITAILVFNLYIHYSYTKIYSYPLVAYPFIELRHFVFAIMVMFGAIAWQNLKWVGFNSIFGIFKYLAPCSYVIYISHHYLVVEATYLNFINNKVIEYGLYILIMIIFSYIVEVVIYNRIRKVLIG